MPYATRSDLTALGLPSGALTGISTDVQDAALLAASDRADGYLRARFKLPLTAYGSDLTEAVCAIAAYSLLVTRGYAPDGEGNESIRLRYEDAIRWLKDIAGSLVTPTVTDSSSSSSPAPPRVTSGEQRGW